MTALWIGVALLLGNAFFVGAEFAIISARRSQIEPLAEDGDRRARLTLRGMESVSLMLAGAQLGITVCSIGLGAVAEPALAHLIEPALASLGLPDTAIHAIAFIIALTIVVYLHVVIGEMVPKNLALARPERSAIWLAPPLWFVTRVFSPLIAVLNAVANAALRLLGIQPKDEVAATFTADEVATLIAESRREGMLGESESRLAEGALDLEERPAASLVIPPAGLRTVDREDSPMDLLAATAETGFSRFPVTGNGKPIGYLHVRDVLGLKSDVQETMQLGSLNLRRLPLVAADAAAASVVEILRTQGAHLARVVDPDGVERGIIALEDALEELIGEVQDAAHR